MPIYRKCYKCNTNVLVGSKHRCISKSKDIGVNRDVRSVWTSKRWLRLREYVYSKYSMCGCGRCGSVDTLQLHHIVKVKDDITKAYDIDNVVLLCPSCHKYIDNNCNNTLDFKFDKYCYDYTII